MRITKLLSVFLAALMLFSCVAGALATGVAAEETETETPAAHEYSYSDPREGATKIYYALAGSATTADAGLTDEDTVLATGHNFYGVLTNANIVGKTFEEGSVLVVKFKGNLTLFADGKNTNKSSKVAFGAMTYFREDNTKLPIVIEGINPDKADIINLAKESYTDFANDYYFSNLTFTTTGTGYVSAGSGLVTFHEVNLPAPVEGKTVKYFADAYSGDCFYNWQKNDVAQPEKITANDKDGDGFVDTGFIFGKGTSTGTASVTMTCAGIAATPSGTYGKSSAVVATGKLMTAEQIAAFQGLMQRGGDSEAGITDVIVYGNADYLTGTNNRLAAVRPFEVDAKIVIDNGSEQSDTPEFPAINMFSALKAVGQAEVTVYSGNLTAIYADGNGTGESAEHYYGDAEINVLGGQVNGYVQGFCDAYIIGDLSINVGGDAIITGTIQGSRASSVHGWVTGNYTFTLSGNASIKDYVGASLYQYRSVSGEDVKPTTNNVNGGTVNGTFCGLNYYSYGDVENNITAGTFKSTFTAGVKNKSTVVTDITTNINGITGQAADYEEGTTEFALAGANYPRFMGTFNAGHSATSGTKAGNIKTIVSDGCFDGTVNKGQVSGTATSATFDVVSTKSTDIVKFGSKSYEIDNFSMNGGRLDFYKATIVANNATGSVQVRNTGSWAATDTYSITFPGAAGNLTVTCLTAGTDPTNVGKAVEENGDVYVTDGYVPAPAGVAPTSATLIMDQKETAVGIRFFFDIDEVDAIDGFTYDILLGETSIAGELEEIEGQYAVATYAIGYADFNTTLTFGGSIVTDETYSLASIAGLAADQWTDSEEAAWQNWAQALVNLAGPQNAGGADLTKTYGEITLTKGNLEADVAGLRADFTMSNVTGIRFTVTFNTMPTDLVVVVNGMDDVATINVEGNVLTIDLAFAAQHMEENSVVKVKNGNTGDFYFDFRGSAAGLAQSIATTDAAADAFLWYIQAAAALAI